MANGDSINKNRRNKQQAKIGNVQWKDAYKVRL